MSFSVLFVISTALVMSQLAAVQHAALMTLLDGLGEEKNLEK